MILPNQQELFKAFSGFLIEAGLSAVSVKNYVSDLRHFLSFCNTLSTTPSSFPDEIVQNISKYVSLYTDNQKRNYTPQNTINRRLASIRRFKTFTDSQYGSNTIFTNNFVKNIKNIDFPETHHIASPLPSPSTLDSSGLTNVDHLKNVDKVLEQFRAYLSKDKKTHSTIKNYVSDINHFLSWSAKETPFSTQTLENLLTETQLLAYVTYLKLNHTSTSVVNRRQSSIKKLAKFSYVSGFISKNPFENIITTPDLAPLSWFNRLSKPTKPQNTSKNRFAIIYRKYNALPFTPYLHLGILALATAAMAIFGYNQIIKSALPSSAATALTPPKRQLSFQGRLTDSTGTPITTAVNVNFKLFNVLTGGSALYSTGNCSVTPDLSGVFNTLIGDGVCGLEINGSVFTDNRDVYLEVGVATETLTPRQQIATVGYALNSETLQGYPASAAATINTVPVIDNSGNINIAAASPSINSTSGTFTINAQALTLKTAANSGGDIVIQPDSLNQGQILAIGGTTNEDSLRITNANLTTGALISGYVGSNAYTGRLLSLTSGSTETDRFYVGTNGQTMINTVAGLTNSALIVNQVGTGDLFTASSSGTNRFVISNAGSVGIGTTSPGQTLDVATGNAVVRNKLNVGGGSGSIYGNPVTFAVTGQSYFVSNVGVKTIGPDRTFDILDASNPQMRLTHTDGTVYTDFQTTSAGELYINPSGSNVGIGVTNPGYALDVNGSVNITGQYLINGTPFTSSNWQRTSGSLAPLVITDSINLGATATNSATVHLAGTSGDDSFFRTGNLGIGLTNPDNLLQINAGSAVSALNSYTLNSTAYGNQLFSGSGTTGISPIIGAGGYTGGTIKGDLLGDIHGSVGVTGFSHQSGSGGTKGVGVYGYSLRSAASIANSSDMGIGGYFLSEVGSATTTMTAAANIVGVYGDANTTATASITGGTVTGVYGRGVGITNNTVIGGYFTGTGGTTNYGIYSAAGTNYFNGNVGIGSTNPQNGLEVGTNAAGKNAIVYATLGAEQAPALAAGNWTVGAGWESPIVGPGLIKNADGTGTVTPTAATTIVAGTTYKVVITIINRTVGSATYTLGGVVSPVSLTANTTYTDYITATTTGKLIITPTNTARFTISAISIMPLTNNTGDLLAEGNFTSGSNATFNGNVTVTGLSHYYNQINMHNSNITAVNTVISDPGANEGYSWAGTTAGWYVDISPLDRSNADGNLNLYGTTNNIALWRPVLFVGNATNYTTATPSTAGDLNFTSTGTGDLTFNPGGEVGIGLTNPTYDLDVVGDINLTGALRDNGSAGTSGQILSSTGTGVQWIDAPTGSGSSPWTWAAGVIYPNTITDTINLGNAATNSATVHLPGLINNDAFFNLGAGNLGVGLTNPAFTLDVAGDINVSGDYYVDGVLFSSSNWQRTADSLAPKIITDSVNIGSTATNSAVVHLAGTAGDSSFIGSGDFGIGLTNPTNTLYLSRAGSAGITIDADTDNVTETDIPTLSFKSDGGTERLLIGVEGTAGTTFTGSIADTSFIESAAATLGLQFATNNTARMTIEESGDVGIGNTTPGYNLDVTGTINASSIYRLGSQLLAQYDTAELEIGSHAVGNTLAFWSGGAQRITVDASGNTGIGATPGSFKLTVAGHTGPETTNSYDLGSAALQWRNIYGQTIYQNGTAIDNLFVKLQASTPGTQQTGNLNISGAGIFGGDLSANGNITLGDAVGDSVTSNAGAWSFTNKTTVALNNSVDSLNFDSNTLSIDALNNRIGIGTSAPGATFQVGTGTGFQVNASGAIIAATGITSSGTITFSGLGTGIVHANSSGVLSSSAVNLASADVTGVLPLANGGTNNDNVVSPYVSGNFLAYDGTRLISSAYDQTSFEAPLTFNNGLTRTLNTVALGGTLLADTTINQDTFDMVFNGTGDFGIGVASPSQKLDVGGIFVVDTVNTRVGIGTTTPAAKLDIAGAASIISNDSGDITLNAASGFFNLSGDSITNVLNATFSGQVKLGAFADAGRPTPIGAGSLIYSTTTNAPQFYDGSVWRSLTNFFSRDTAGIIYPTTWYDSINLGSTTGASASAIIRLSTNDTFNTFFKNPIAVGYSGSIDNPSAGYTGLEVFGSIVPRNTSGADNLGHSSRAWGRLYLFNGINDTSGTEVVSISSRRLTGGDWNATNGLRVGSVGTVPVGYKLFVDGNATTSGGLDVYANLSVGGNAVIGGGTGKIDVGTVDPPYTIGGEKYATYMAGMIGLKEEVVGKVFAQNSTYIENVGYRTLIDLDDQDKINSNDLWLFSKTTNIKENINQLSVLLTAEGQGKTWYQVDEVNKILAIYSSTPSDVTYRLTAPRFDSYKWTNIRTSASAGHIITDVTAGQNVEGTGLLAPIANNISMIAQIDGTYSLTVNGTENFEISSIYKGLIANLTAGAAAVTELVADNLTIRTKLISPIAEIDDLKTINATVSGTLYADNIKGATVDNLTGQLDLLSEKYATASAILADLQAKYTNYSTLLGATSVATISGDPLALSPLATTSATFPSDLALESLNVHTIIANDIMANGSLFTNSLSSFDAALFIQPLRNQPVNLMANLLILYPDGKIAVNGDLLISGTLFANAIDTKTATVSGTLALGKGTLASDSAALISLFGDNGQVVGSVDASGSANFNSLATSGLIIAADSNNIAATSSATINSNATIGIAKIATGASEIIIANNKVTDSTLVYITPISDTSNQVLYVKSKTSGTGFTVAVPAPVANEVSFNYWLVQTK